METGQSRRTVNRSHTRDRVLRLISDVVNNKDVILVGDELLEALPGWDSLTVVEFMIGVETHFNLRLDPDELESCTTIDDLADLVLGNAA